MTHLLGHHSEDLDHLVTGDTGQLKGTITDARDPLLNLPSQGIDGLIVIRDLLAITENVISRYECSLSLQNALF